MSRPNGFIANSGLELLTFGVPSGYKISIMLEELKAAYGVEYAFQVINIAENVQKDQWFTQFSPNGRIPVLVDHENDIALMEGQAILNYLVRKYDPDFRFSFREEKEQILCEQWIGWVQSHLGPISAESVYFLRFAPEHDQLAIQHFVGELERLYGVLDARLSTREYVLGEKFSIADVAAFAVIDVGPTSGVERSKFSAVDRWHKKIAARPAVQRGSSTPFPNPMLGRAYSLRIEEEPDFKDKEDNVFKQVENAKVKYGYRYSSP